MSFEAMAWASKQQTGSNGKKLVLLILANHANGHTGQCNPTHKRLSEECEMGTSTVRKHIVELAEQGLLTIVPKFMDGVQLPNQYVLQIEGCSNLAEGMPETSRGVCSNRAPKQEVKPRIETYSVLKPDSVSDEVWNDWLLVRKEKKAKALTQTAWNQIVKQIETSGWTMEEAIAYCCTRNWIGFEASWIPKDRQKQIHTNQHAGAF